MARTAICELRPFLGEAGRDDRAVRWIVLSVVFSLRAMTTQTPTHVDYLRVLIDRHLAYIAMTILAVQPRCNMRTVNKVNEIWHPCYRYPLQRRVILDSLNERG